MTNDSDTSDEFFGIQDDDEDSTSMTRRHQMAMEQQFQNIGFLEAFDRTQDDRLQEGFCSGYFDCSKLAERVGRHWGQICARNATMELKERGDIVDSSLSSSLFKDRVSLKAEFEPPTCEEKISNMKRQKDMAIKLNDFLTNKLQSCNSTSVYRVRDNDMKEIEDAICS